MSNAMPAPEHSVPPSLADLLAGYLRDQADAHAAGVALPQSAEVVPFEAVPVQAIDPKLAWGEATFILRYWSDDPAVQAIQAPPEWPALVQAQSPTVAVAFCLGNFPQLVRDWQPFLHATHLAELRQTDGRALSAPPLDDWVQATARRGSLPRGLLAAGVLRLARQFDAAQECLQASRPDLPAAWQAAWENEQAALLWHRGQAEQAAALWRSQPDSIPVCFNRGMAALFLDQPAQAHTDLTGVRAGLPEDNGWHHLASLYLALAEARA